MSITKTLGGDRLGAGKKEKVHLRHYERSNHDLSYAWRSTMAAGTLVPFMVEVALPGDTFDIDLNMSILTHPTLGPLFGTLKAQLDIFAVPIRLFQGALHMNMLGIGLDMSKVKLPLIRLEAKNLAGIPEGTTPDTNVLENSQINPSCIFNYLGIRGLGYGGVTGLADRTARQFNAIPWLAYWAIYKQYYANKVEEIGAVVHTGVTTAKPITVAEYKASRFAAWATANLVPPGTAKLILNDGAEIRVTIPAWPAGSTPTMDKIQANWATNSQNVAPATGNLITLDKLFELSIWNATTKVLTISRPTFNKAGMSAFNWLFCIYPNTAETPAEEPVVQTFPLSDIDKMRIAILQKDMATPLVIDKATTLTPYKYIFEEAIDIPTQKFLYSKLGKQEGLGLKTYQSDLFNNWIKTEWIDGTEGITAVTAVNVVGGKVTIDEINLKKKLYDMLNRIAVSGGTYDDWLDAVYTHERDRGQEEPAYLGGLIQELAFQEVVGLAASEMQPLGTLAGRGKLEQNRKGGKVVAKISEPSYLIGIASITPRIDYNQGNRWDVNLKTMNDFHKPALDEIGFQDAVTDQFAFWDTMTTEGTNTTFRSAGKQPAWINYMTNYNRTYANFAIENDQAWMVLARKYEMTVVGSPNGVPRIKDLTTYIDPKKFNYVFADVSRDAMNYWVQIGVGMWARRKMSAKVMPNL